MARDVRSIERGRGLLSMRNEIAQNLIPDNPVLASKCIIRFQGFRSQYPEHQPTNTTQTHSDYVYAHPTNKPALDTQSHFATPQKSSPETLHTSRPGQTPPSCSYRPYPSCSHLFPHLA